MRKAARPVSSLAPNHGVDDGIEQQYRQTEQNLYIGSESRRINQWHQVVFDKTGRVSAATCCGPQVVLQIGQWTDPAAKFNQHTPDYRRDMSQGQSMPEENQEATEHDEKNERRMYDEDQVSE